VVLVVEESGRLGVGEGKCELVAVESGKLGMGLVAVESGRLGMGLGEGRYELVVVMMVGRLVVVERNKSIVLLKFQMGN
jgi:hypothetical protein